MVSIPAAVPSLRWPTAVGLALVAGEPLLFGLIRRLGLTRLDLAQQVTLQLVFDWAMVLGVVALVRFGERAGLSSIGIVRPRLGDIGWAAAGFLAAGALVYVTMPLIEALGLDTLQSGVIRISRLSIPLRLAAALTAGITEEILFRGYLVERLAALTGRLDVGVVLSWLLFSLFHLPGWGVGGAIQIAILSSVIYLVYLRRRSVVPCILLHVANDLYAFLVVPSMIPEFP